MSKDTELEKEYWEVMDFLNMCYKLELYDEEFLFEIENKTLLYVYNELNLDKSIISSFIENGYEPHKETLLEWIDGTWSIQDCIHDIFKKSDKYIQKKILDIFKKSIKIHFHSDKDMNYLEFSSQIKEEFEVQKISNLL